MKNIVDTINEDGITKSFILNMKKINYDSLNIIK